MKYERITSRNEEPFYAFDACKECEQKDGCDKWCAHTVGAYTRLHELEDKIESGEIDYVADSKTEQTITDLLIEFDEMGFAPTTVCPNLEQYATEWRERVRKEFARLIAENAELRATLSKMETVEKELRERLEKAVELPVEVGDTIYMVFLDEIKEWQVEKTELCKDEYFVYGGHADTDDYTFVTSKEYGMLWFTDRAEAEARFKELQGGER